MSKLSSFGVIKSLSKMVSTISGPIPPHPYYDNQVGGGAGQPVGRNRPEAHDFAKKGQTGSIATLLIDGLSIAPQPARRYNKPELKDHAKENVRRMRQIQRQTRNRQEEANKPMKALWKSSNYENISSRVRETLEGNPTPTRPQSANYLRAHSRTGFTPSPSRPSTAQPRARSPSVPAASSARELNLMRNNIDFIKINGQSVKSASTMRRSPSLSALDDLKKKKEEEEKSYRKGTVPKYLKQRQKQWHREEQERRANEPDPEMPPGHRMMPEADRKQTLQKLAQTQNDLTQELAKLPIRSDTVRMRTIKESLEKKMSEVEEAIKIFSRPKVFVKLDT